MVAAHSPIAGGRAQIHAADVDQTTVLIVDDDELMRSALRRLMVTARLAAEFYASGAEFLAQAKLDRPGCLILDVGMPGMSGLEVQRSLTQRRVDLPVIFLTGSSDIPIAVAAMREGAVDFIEKPFENDDLIARVRQAIDRHSHRRKEHLERDEVVRRLSSLTARERSVLELVVAGKTNKEIARVLGASHRTIEIHRHRVMEKMAAPTLADLVRMWLWEGNEPPA